MRQYLSIKRLGPFTFRRIDEPGDLSVLLVPVSVASQ